MAGFAKRLATSTTKADIFSGIESTGKYEVVVTLVNGSYLTTNSSASTSDSVNMTKVDPFDASGSGQILRFVWDSSTPLYVFTNSGSGWVDLIVSPVASVGLSVNCS